MRAEARSENPAFWARRPLALAMMMTVLVVPTTALITLNTPSVLTIGASGVALGLLGLFVRFAARMRRRMVEQAWIHPLTMRQKTALALYGVGFASLVFGSAIVPASALVGLAMLAAGYVIAWREDRALASDAKQKSVTGGMLESYRQSYLGSIAVTSFIMLLNFPATLALVLIAVRMIPTLASAESVATFTVPEMMNDMFGTYLQLIPIMFATGFGYVSGATLVAWMIHRWRQNQIKAALPEVIGASASLHEPINQLSDEDDSDEEQSINLYQIGDQRNVTSR
jgi:hypothetical protein